VTGSAADKADGVSGMAENPAGSGYRVLARKYRPQNFSDLIGQEPMVQTLTNAFDMGRIAQAWMLTGVRGVGKTTTARILARALNYKTATVDKPTVHLTEIGEHCQAIMEGRHVDVVEMDAASHTGIDDVREIIEQVRYRPVSARYKVYIIDEVHMLSTQAFNGLLKTLEEPPPHVKFIFATTEIRKVPVTVLSRCQRFDLRRVDTAVLTGHLQKIAKAEGIEAENAALAMIARAGEGSVRDCLSLLDQAIAHSGAISGGEGKIRADEVRAQLGLADRTQIIALFDFIMRGQVREALEQMQRLYAFGADPTIIIRELLDFNHFVTRLRFMPALADDVSISEEERKAGSQFAEKLSIRVLSRAWQMLLKGLSEVENAARPLAAAEMLIIRLTHAADLPNLDDALRALETGKSGNQEAGNTASAQKIVLIQTAANNLPPAPMGDTKADISVSAEIKKIAESKGESSAIIEKPAADSAPAEQREKSQAENQPAKVISSDPLPEHSAPNKTFAKNSAPAQSADKADSAANIKKNTESEFAVKPENAPHSAPPPAPASEISLKQLAQMAENQGKLQLKFYLREAVRLVLLQAPQGDNPGFIRIQPTDLAPRDIERQIGNLLLEETGARWRVEAIEQGGGATLAEEEERQKKALFTEAANNPEVAAVMRLFPQAKLVDVRVEEPEETPSDTDEADADYGPDEEAENA